MAFLFRILPHFFVYRWLSEEPLVYRLVDDLIMLGRPREDGFFYNPLTTYSVYGLWLLTKINPMTIAQCFNPAMGALAIIPLYFLSKEFLDKKSSLLLCTFYAFSEVAFYRTASYGSVEPIGFLFAITTLYFYKKHNLSLTCMSLFLTFLGHIQPFVYAISVIFIDTIFFGNTKKRILGAVLLIAGVGILYTPFLPYQAARYMIEPQRMISSIDPTNLITVYSFGELVGVGLSIFTGIFLLLLLSLPSLLKTKKDNIMFSMLFTTTMFFLWAWISYNDLLTSPIRWLWYFSPPLLYYTVKTLSQLKHKKQMMLSALIVVCMVTAALQGYERVLWFSDSLTAEEYTVLDEVSFLIVDPGLWWADYPAKMSIIAASAKNWIAVPTQNISYTIDWCRAQIEYKQTFASPDITFQYVFLSDRMSRNAMLLNRGLVGDRLRNTPVHMSIEDIWKDSPRWKLIYENYGVKIYEEITS